MTENAQLMSPSLKNRRQELRNQRRLKFGQSVWRWLALTSAVGGLFWAMSLPYWLIRDKTQIEVEGNQLLSTEQVYRWLGLSYPQSFWQVPIAQLQSRLQQQSPVAEAYITRQMVPPSLKIHLQERQPVASATTSEGAGFLDANGIFIPKALYPTGEKALKTPYLKVLGYDRLYQSRWPALYATIRESPVRIDVLDWRDPSNLVLHTELGLVRMGGDAIALAEQFKILSQMGSLPSRVPRDRVVYIDLTNPRTPLLKLKPEPAPEDGQPKDVKKQ